MLPDGKVFIIIFFDVDKLGKVLIRYLIFFFPNTELGDLPLVKLDFSCNKITEIPICYRKLRHLQVIVLDNNPMQIPPAQVSTKTFCFSNLH